MPSFRTQRINEEVRREIEAIIATAVKDPGLSGMVSVVRAEVTRDLAHAKIYISVYGDKAQLDSAIEGLARANGFIRRELAQRLELRRVPELHFVADDSIAYAVSMSKKANRKRLLNFSVRKMGSPFFRILILTEMHLAAAPPFF